MNERGPNGVTALIVATEARNMELIKLLLAKGADRTLKVRPVSRYAHSRHAHAEGNASHIVTPTMACNLLSERNRL